MSTINGTSGNDSLTGTSGGDEVNAGEGADTVHGNSGNDTIYGGSGTDSIDGGQGNDTIDGGNDGDTIDGGTDNDSISGGSGQDSIQGGDGADTIDGGNDGDTIDGGSGADSIHGGSGQDSIAGGDGNDTIDGGDHSDSISGGSGDNSIRGGTGDDTLIGGDQNDTIEGGDDNDSIVGGTGDDSLSGDAGSDTISGGGGYDEIDGGEGNDSIDGGTENDALSGGGGDDSIDGGSGDDALFGDAGNDTLTGGQGSDYFEGGSGDDTYHVGGYDGGNQVIQFGHGSDQDTAYGWDPSTDHVYIGNIDKADITFTATGDPKIWVLGISGGDPNDTLTLDFSFYWDSGVTEPELRARLLDENDYTPPSRSAAPPACLTPASLIDTPTGSRRIGNLKPGDLVLTLDHGPQPILRVLSQIYQPQALVKDDRLRPVILEPGCLGPNRPNRKMTVSRQHAFCLDGTHLVRAIHLSKCARGVRVQNTRPNPVRYVNLLLERHEIVRVDGVWVETFFTGPAATSLHPELRATGQHKLHAAPARPVADRRAAARLVPDALSRSFDVPA